MNTSKRYIFKLIVVLLLLGQFKGEAQSRNGNNNLVWLSSSKNINELDSLIKDAAKWALNKNDYRPDYLDALRSPNNLFLNKTDSVKADSIINTIALHFFKELAYGNHAPALQYEGVNFKLNTYNIPALLTDYLKHKSLTQLVNYLNSRSVEVATLLKTLAAYQDSIPVKQAKLQLLTKAVNDYRWLNAIKQNQNIVLVNIPSAQLRAYQGNATALFMKVIVGKRATPTNTLSSPIYQLMVNPYWVVPKSIATKEMLPKLKKDNGYINNNHLQVLNKNYRVVNPNNINWQDYDINNFPFTIRQSTGCDNSLGILKVEFDSPFGIYLHDTPEKALFSTTNRFYSHGCMRMEKPLEMGKWLFKNNPIALDSIDLSKCYNNPKPIPIPVTNNSVMIVWYSLIDFDEKGNVHFYKNIYNK